MESQDVKINFNIDTQDSISREMKEEIELGVLESKLNPSFDRWSMAWSIHSIPNRLRKINEEAYTPRTVSIGPLHYDKPHLQAMQPNKLRFFFRRIESEMDRYNQMAKAWEQGARECYQSNITLNSEEFIKMILLDGIFIIEVLLRMCKPELFDWSDDVFELSLLSDDIFHDMLLLENQIPFFVLKDLYLDIFQKKIPICWDDFLCLVANKIMGKKIERDIIEKAMHAYKIWHVVDFYHVLCLVLKPTLFFVPTRDQKYELLSRGATELHKAGVKFMPPKSNVPYLLNFIEEDDVLEISSLMVNAWTDSFFRNLIAYEHCLHKNKIISSYIIMLASLLNTSKDVDLLIESKIIDNRSLRTCDDICEMFNNLCERSMMDNTEFSYTSLCDDLNAYSSGEWWPWLKVRCYRWQEVLKHDYFNNPWSIISVIAAVVLLVLTVLQTISSISTMKWP